MKRELDGVLASGDGSAFREDRLPQKGVDALGPVDRLGYDDIHGRAQQEIGVFAGETLRFTTVVTCQVASEMDCRDNELGYMYYRNCPTSPSGPNRLPTSKRGRVSRQALPTAKARVEYESQFGSLRAGTR